MKMKKLIVLALAATLGVVANAASVTWGVNSVSLTANQADATKYTASGPEAQAKPILV